MAFDQSRDSPAERKISWRVRPFWHAFGYVAARRGVVDLTNYEIEMGYFPVALGGMKPQADYLMVWDLAGKGRITTATTVEALQSGYEVVYRSPHRWATLYRKKVG